MNKTMVERHHGTLRSFATYVTRFRLSESSTGWNQVRLHSQYPSFISV
ncbi:hypothetical protein V6Z11_A06G077900 [Gossypium hirsutum]